MTAQSTLLDVNMNIADYILSCKKIDVGHGQLLIERA